MFLSVFPFIVCKKMPSLPKKKKKKNTFFFLKKGFFKTPPLSTNPAFKIIQIKFPVLLQIISTAYLRAIKFLTNPQRSWVLPPCGCAKFPVNRPAHGGQPSLIKKLL